MRELVQIRSAYLRGRRKEAVQMAAAASLFLGLLVVLSTSMSRAAPFAFLALVEVALAVVWGGLSGRKILAFVVLGGLPYATAVGSTFVGHACTPSGCVSLCAPMCAAGGALGGLLLSRVCLRAARPLRAWGLGSLLLVSTGAIGCACVGSSGVLGMCVGLLVGSLGFFAQSLLPRSRAGNF